MIIQTTLVAFGSNTHSQDRKIPYVTKNEPFVTKMTPFIMKKMPFVTVNVNFTLASENNQILYKFYHFLHYCS